MFQKAQTTKTHRDPNQTQEQYDHVYRKPTRENAGKKTERQEIKGRESPLFFAYKKERNVCHHEPCTRKVNFIVSR